MCDITPSEIETWTSIIQNIVLAISALGTLSLAFYGITSWNREFRGKRDAELCEEVLEKFYQAQEAIIYMRSPIVHGHELSESENYQGGGDKSPSQSAQDSANVLFKRYKHEHELFSRIYALRYRFMARFGKGKIQPFEDLHTALNKLFFSARMLSDLWPSRANHFRTDKHYKQYLMSKNEYEKVFWRSGDNDDEFESNIDVIVKSIEKICRPYINN